MTRGLFLDHVVGPIFFEGPTTNKTNYRQMLQNHGVQLPELLYVIFQQDSAVLHCSTADTLAIVLVQCFQVAGSEREVQTHASPPPRLNLAPTGFFSWGYVKDRMYQK